jgi:hypothetical protein
MKKNITDEQIMNRVQRFRNYLNRMNDGRTVAIRTTVEFNEVFKLAETSGYKGHMYNADNLQELVEEMALENYSRPNSNREHMRDVSGRITMMFGANIRFDSEYNFIEDLIRSGYIRLYNRPNTLKKVYRSQLAWNKNGEYENQKDQKHDISRKIQRKVQSQGNSQDIGNEVQKRHKNTKIDKICNALVVLAGSYFVCRFSIGLIFNI